MRTRLKIREHREEQSMGTESRKLEEILGKGRIRGWGEVRYPRMLVTVFKEHFIQLRANKSQLVLELRCLCGHPW